MSHLSTELRKQLESAIKTARRTAESGAHKALRSLAVDRHEPHGSMTPDERSLRNRLRAHGRQLGDVRDKGRGTQSIDRLAHEVAYEHWHRMLFARFLAENNLLIEPRSGVAITMTECDELARDEGADPRALAASFAQASLPQIFRPDDPVLELVLAPEVRQTLNRLLGHLPEVIFTADDSLGWTYEYWQSEQKRTINASGNKIGANELPAVTQLFTEHYMVLFLFHNTIGAWHAARVLAEDPSLAESAQSEQELRRAVRLRSLGGYDFEYLRFVREARSGDDPNNSTGPWRPAAGAFGGWPQTARALRVLDPSCGSGHFLTEGLRLLTRLRMDEDGTEQQATIRAVLSQNLCGLEIDTRCTQIAAFNLAMTAWKMAGTPFEIGQPQVACSGQGVASNLRDWTRLSRGDELLRSELERLYQLFRKAPDLGSLINPNPGHDEMLAPDSAELEPLLLHALASESEDGETLERAIAAQGMSRAAELLAGRYTLVITNVPYLGRSDQSENLKNYADRHFPNSNKDLATVFLERIRLWLDRGGTAAVVTPQNWLFLTTYRALRKKLLAEMTWNFTVWLGEHAFQSTSAAGAFAAMIALSAERPTKESTLAGLDVSATRLDSPIFALEKASLLLGGQECNSSATKNSGRVQLTRQLDQMQNPDAIVMLGDQRKFPFLSKYAVAYQGTSTGDNSAHRLNFWEVQNPEPNFGLFQSSSASTLPYSGRDHIVRKSVFAPGCPSTVRGRDAWNRNGVAVSQTGRLVPTLYTGEKFSNTIPVIVPHREIHLLPVWCFCESGALEVELRKLIPKLSVDNGYFGKIEFDIDHWMTVATEKYPDGLPQPYSNDPTQWIFHGHPAAAAPPVALQAAVARLVGYIWPAELDSNIHISPEAREWVGRCRGLEHFADDDGIVCLGATRGERKAADRLRDLLANCFGDEWSATKERELLSASSPSSSPAHSIEDWLRDNFFAEHCRLFQNRPFVWHIWDGNKHGFHCLVNAHKLTGGGGEARQTLEAIAYSYLGDWIDRMNAEKDAEVDGADDRLAAARDLQAQLENILEGEPPYDIFVRWKALHAQAIGWEPDVEDGVRMNIRPFMKAKLRKGGKKGAGLLRCKPTINWTKDRGIEQRGARKAEEFPWLWGFAGDEENRIDLVHASSTEAEYDGKRWNDLHFSNRKKLRSRNERSGGRNGS